MALAAEIAGSVRSRFATLVATPQSLQTVYDNMTDVDVPPDSRWCRLSVQLGQAPLVSVAAIGQRRFRTTGVALAQLFEPIGIGDGAQLGLVSAIQDAFRAVDLAGPPQISFDAPYVSAPPVREDSWWQCVVAIPFTADEFA